MFAHLAAPATIEDALDDLVDGIVQAAVVDNVGLASYARRKPGRFAKLKVLLTSEPFPDTVVAYRDRCVDEATLQRLQQGLTQAHKSPVGRNMLALWNITSFEAKPADFESLLASSAKAYPTPGTAEAKLTSESRNPAEASHAAESRERR